MDINEFLSLKKQGKTNQQIADLWKVSISTVKRFIRNNNLTVKKNTLKKEDFLKLYEEGKQDEEIAQILQVTKTAVYNLRRSLKLDSQRDRARKIKQNKFIELYKEGKNDSEIARILGVSNYNIHCWRESLIGKSSNFKYTRKFDIEKFYDLFYSGLNYTQIAEQLNVGSSCIQKYAQVQGLEANTFCKDIPTERQQQIIVGSLLGDMGLYIPKLGKHATGCFAHSLKQENYCKWLETELKNFCNKGIYKEQHDKRTNKTYKSYFVPLKASEYLTTLYYKFYPNGKKIIPKDLLYSLNGLGVAIWFMDDGYKDCGSFKIATNCFSTEDLLIVQEFFKIKFNINISIHKDHTIYIKADSKELFRKLITPYIHQDCLYKMAR